MNVGREPGSDLRNRNATDRMRYHNEVWAAVDALASRIGSPAACQFVLRMLLLRIIRHPDAVEDPWAWFKTLASQGEDGEASVDQALEAALRQWASEMTAQPEAWEMSDFILHPTEETGEALNSLILAVDAARGDLVQLFDLVLERHSRTAGEAGAYFTPRSLVRLVVNLLDPRPGERVFDPACGSAGFLVAAAEYVQAARDGVGLVLAGRDMSRGARQVATMNLLAHGLQAQLGEGPTNSLIDSPGAAPDSDVVVLNPPFNQKGWASDAEIKRRDWPFGRPPRSNANFAWLQHAVSLLTPNGRACVLMPAGSTRDSRMAAREIVRQLVEGDVIDAIVMLPDGLFPHLRVSACLWVLSRGKGGIGNDGERDRRHQTLFIDARAMAEQVNRGHWEIPDTAVTRIAQAVRSWRSPDWQSFQPHALWAEHQWCAVASRAEVEANDFDLTPTRYLRHESDESDIESEIYELTQRLLARIDRVQELDALLLEALDQW